jgi:DNA invertase Pin-like site-specific DNA recombinase
LRGTARDKYDHFALRSHLKSLGISLRSATEPIDDTSTGKLMKSVLAAFAQFDNDVRSDRTRAGDAGSARARCGKA